MTRHASRRKSTKPRFLDDQSFNLYRQPKVVAVAHEMLCKENISEEAFLGARAVELLSEDNLVAI